MAGDAEEPLAVVNLHLAAGVLRLAAAPGLAGLDVDLDPQPRRRHLGVARQPVDERLRPRGDGPRFGVAAVVQVHAAEGVGLGELVTDAVQLTGLAVVDIVLVDGAEVGPGFGVIRRGVATPLAVLRDLGPLLLAALAPLPRRGYPGSSRSAPPACCGEVA